MVGNNLREETQGCRNAHSHIFAALDLNATSWVWHQHQCSHRLEKYFNIQDCLEKSLKNKFALKSTGKNTQRNFTIYRRIQHYLWRPKSV